MFDPASSHEKGDRQAKRHPEKQLSAAIDRPGVDYPAMRAALINSQMLGLALARYILELKPLTAVSSDTIALLFAPKIQCYLSLELPMELMRSEAFHRDE